MNPFVAWPIIIAGFAILLFSAKKYSNPQRLYRLRFLCIVIITAFLPQQITTLFDIPRWVAFVINFLLIWIIIEILSRDKTEAE